MHRPRGIQCSAPVLRAAVVVVVVGSVMPVNRQAGASGVSVSASAADAARAAFWSASDSRAIRAVSGLSAEAVQVLDLYAAMTRRSLDGSALDAAPSSEHFAAIEADWLRERAFAAGGTAGVPALADADGE